uniref:Putative secreted protein n=1 Tax=Anopheles triannulatus TaxID=58253 RepID=A0A2M4B166_9DIPT
MVSTRVIAVAAAAASDATPKGSHSLPPIRLTRVTVAPFHHLPVLCRVDPFPLSMVICCRDSVPAAAAAVRHLLYCPHQHANCWNWFPPRHRRDSQND